MLRGIDVSDYNATNLNLNDYDFVMIKATEGVRWKAGSMIPHLLNVKEHAKLFGFYHYARPETGNTPESEAEYFVSIVEQYARGETLLALDWEGASLGVSLNWARRFLDRVFELTGIKPLFYTSAGYTDNLGTILDGDYGLWVASWGVDTPYTGVYPFWAMWQYSNSDGFLDLDYFNGDYNTWLAYASIKEHGTTQPITKVETPKHCSCNCCK